MRFITYTQGKYIMPRRGKWTYIKMLILYMPWYKNHWEADWDKLIMFMNTKKSNGE